MNISYFRFTALIFTIMLFPSASRAENAVEQACNFNFNRIRCIAACRSAEARLGKAHAYDDNSHVTQKTCDGLLRSIESKSLVDSACSEKSCIYKLKIQGKISANTSTFVGHGYKLTMRVAPHPEYAGGYIYDILDGKGRVTRLSSCGSCDISNSEYEKGPLKGATVASGQKGEVILRIPNK